MCGQGGACQKHMESDNICSGIPTYTEIASECEASKRHAVSYHHVIQQTHTNINHHILY